MAPEMDKLKEKSPFSLYDFFGYLFPGFFLVLSIWILFLLEGYTKASALPPGLSAINEQIQGLSRGGVLSKLFLFSIGIVAIYGMGHAIATISHVLLDRLFMQRVLGYPALSILGIAPSGEYQTSGYVIAFTFALIALLGSCAFSMGCPVGTWIIWTGIGGTLCGVVGVALVAILKGLIALSPRRASGRTRSARSPAAIARYWKSLGWVRVFRNLYRYTFGVLVKILRGLLSLDKPLSQDVREGILSQLEKDFGIRKSTSPSDLFWLIYYRTTQLSPSVDAQIRNWVNLYGYCRNFAVASLVVPLMILARQFVPDYNPPPFEGWMSLLFLTLFILFVLRYVLLYSSYYTKNTFRAYYALTRPNPLSQEVRPS